MIRSTGGEAEGAGQRRVNPMTYGQALTRLDLTPPVRVSTGLRELDSVLNGGVPVGTVAVLISRPRVGRSTLGLQFARIAAAHEHGVLFCGRGSLEQVVARLRASQSGVTLRASEDPDPAEQERLAQADTELAAANLWLGWAASEDELRAHVRNVRSPLQMVVIDGLYETDLPLSWRPTIRDLVWFARGTHVALLVTAGVPAATNWPTGLPHLVDVEHPGDIAESADFVLSLGRPDELGRSADDEHVGEATLRLVLNRHGPTGDVRLAFQGARARFVSL